MKTGIWGLIPIEKVYWTLEYLIAIKHTTMMKFKIKSGLFFCMLLLTGITNAQIKEVYIEGYDDMTYSKEQIIANPGQQLKVILKTISDLPEEQMAHNFVLLKKETDVMSFVTAGSRQPSNEYIEPTYSDRIIAATDMLAGGESDTVMFKAPEETGEYEYVCTFPGHYIAGMKGTLEVK